MVDWLAGKRVRGTSSERSGFGLSLGGTGVGGWVEVGRTTLGSNGDNINVTSLADKRYYMILGDLQCNATGCALYTRFNADTGSNYARRVSDNGGADASNGNAIGIASGQNCQTNEFYVGYVANYATKEKLLMYWLNDQETAGAGTAPSRHEHTGKWANTSNAINEIDIQNYNSGDFVSGAEVVVLGYNPSDTHTNNFWQELASANGDGTASFDTGTFTAKKYLWIQAFIKRSSDSTNTLFRVGNSTIDTGSNYSWRKSSDGGADSTGTSQSSVVCRTGGGADNTEFYNIFIINNTSNEKLIIMHLANKNSSGAATAPLRSEIVAKWTNTSNQINIVGFNSGGANTLSSTSIVKVWGAD